MDTQVDLHSKSALYMGMQTYSNMFERADVS